MIALPGYQITEEIQATANTIIYRGIREADRQRVVIKVPCSEHPTLEEIASLRQEYQITQSLKGEAIENIVKSYSFEPYKKSYALVVEDVVGKSLKQLCTSEKLKLRESLRIFISLAETLGKLHNIPVLHKDIKPSNIIVNSETGQVKITDFGIASRLEVENPTISNPDLLEGTLAYMSPEQTGRMNRSIDYRTDYYALGASFYEVLTGQVPFLTTDPMELVHCHLAITPVPPHQLNPEVPEAVSAVVMKLLAKNAEDRYQSAIGLKWDLEKCLTQLQTEGKIDTFPLGQSDRGSQLLIPQKLYGREAEVTALLEAFERVSSGTAEMVLVSGYSGIGKTAIVNEVHKPIVAKRGYFMAGKFDQFKRNIPYAALIQAFSDLVQQLLTETSETLELWKSRLKDAIGENGQVIIDVIPEIELIVGPQPQVPELGPTESQNRFNRVFQHFISVFAQPSHPLVLFLDDLQWADLASLKLIELLVADPERQYLLLIGAYRDNEVSPTHPLIQTLEKIQEVGAAVNHITIQPLSPRHVSQLVAETLGETDSAAAEMSVSAAKTLVSLVGGNGEWGTQRASYLEREGVLQQFLSLATQNSSTSEPTQPLADLLYQKTQGNPFFLTQLLKTLYSEKLLTYEVNSPTTTYKAVATGRWQWDITEIQAVGIADCNVVELIARNIEKLSASTQKILKFAACIGNSFNLEVLAVANQEAAAVTAAQLWPALQAGLILPRSKTYKIPLMLGSELGSDHAVSLQDVNVNYKFLHDRVQQAAYSLIPEAEKQVTHLEIGRLLLKNTPPEQRKENIFALVNQLNFGIGATTGGLPLLTQEERDELAELNLIAGQRAKAAAAYEAAVNYLNVGLGLLAVECWQSHYPLALALYVEAVEAEYLNTNFERSSGLAQVALAKAKTLLEKVKVYEIQIQSCFARNEMQTALDLGLQVLEMLGVSLEPTPPSMDIIVEELADLPVMVDPVKLAAMRVLHAISSAAFITNPQMFGPIVFTRVNFCIKQGNSPLAAMAYVDYAMILCGVMGEIELGYRYGELSLQVLEKFNVKSLKCQVLNTFNAHVRHWKTPLKETLDVLQDAVASGLETGDLMFTCIAAINYCYNTFFGGVYLDKFASDARKYTALMAKLKQNYLISSCQLLQQVGLNLLGKSESTYQLIGEVFNETIVVPIYQEYKIFTALFFFYLYKSILLYLFKEKSQAVETARLAEQYAGSVPGLLAVAQHNFYYSLALLTQYPSVSPEEQSEYLSQVTKNQEKMKNWADHGPMNFQHKYDLVEAEKARVLGQKWEAAELYDRAITEAKKQGYVQEEAIANELAGEFHIECDHKNLSRFYIIESYYAYIRWGATAKVKKLEQDYPNFLYRISEQNNAEIDPHLTVTRTTTSGGKQILDLPAVMKASQAISSEIVLERLLEKLIEIAIENAGAEKGALILRHSKQLIIEATGVTLGGVEGIKGFRKSEPLENSQDLPISLVSYVNLTQRNVVLNDAANDKMFGKDRYIQEHQVKSVLCAPIIEKGKFIGLVYLENNLLTGAFSCDRIKVLNILCGQAAISLENARLYQKSQDYAQQLEQSLQDLANAQLMLVQSEKMSALGQLVAGVAHEINNPIGFIDGNISYAKEYTQDLLNLVQLYQEHYPNPPSAIAEEIESMDLEYLREDLPKIISSMKEGSDRIRNISTSLRTFSRSDTSKKVPFNIHEGIDSTLLILKHRLKANQERPAIEIVKEYGQLPLVECYPGQLNQVFMNIIANAIDAIDEFCQGHSFEDFKANPNTIAIQTAIRLESKAAVIHIKDNGPGMPPEVRERVFDHLFTTKAAGKGTGLGLSISHQIVVQKHGGSLSINSAVGQGSEFIIEIPL